MYGILGEENEEKEEVEKKKNQYKASRKIAEVYLKDVFTRKNTFLQQINDISLGLYSNINISQIRELLELRVFYNYNVLNAGALEFIIRFINSRKMEIEDTYGSYTPGILREFIFSLPCYVMHIKRIKEGKDTTFFLENGTQNEKKIKTFNDYVKKILDSKNYIPIDRELDKGIDVDATLENESPGEEPGLDSSPVELNNPFENSDLDVEEPSPEELMK
jgi:hypothetical protein